MPSNSQQNDRQNTFLMKYFSIFRSFVCFAFVPLKPIVGFFSRTFDAIFLFTSLSLSLQMRVLLTFNMASLFVYATQIGGGGFGPKWKSMKIIFYVSIPLRPFVFVINNRDSFISFNRFELTGLRCMSGSFTSVSNVKTLKTWGARISGKCKGKFKESKYSMFLLKIWSFWCFDNDNL